MPPQRGYDSATYYWDRLSDAVRDNYPFLPAVGSLYIHQSYDNKQLFEALITNKADDSCQKMQFDSKDRERLELALISEGTVDVDVDSDYEASSPLKKDVTLPYLATAGSEDLDFSIIAKPIYDDASAYFNGKANAGDSYYDGDPDNYVIPVLWELYDMNSPSEQNESNDPEFDSNDRKVGAVFGHLILTKQILQDGWDPLLICDDISGDLSYVMSVLSDSAGPLNTYDGIEDENILYIDEIKLESDYETPEVESRIIRELPWLCMRFMHIRPEIIVYCISELVAEDEQKSLAMPYMRSGFVRVGETNVLYAYTE